LSAFCQADAYEESDFILIRRNPQRFSKIKDIRCDEQTIDCVCVMWCEEILILGTRQASWQVFNTLGVCLKNWTFSGDINNRATLR
jgi:hypothetical protein